MKIFKNKWTWIIIAFIVIVGALGNSEEENEATNEKEQKVEVTENSQEKETESDSKKSESDKVDEEVTADADGVEYADKVIELSAKLANVFGRFSELMMQAGENTALLFDDGWKIDLAGVIVDLDTTINDFRSLTPPDQLKDSHEYALKAMDEYEYVVTDLPSAIDNRDVAAMNEIIEHMNKGNEYLSKATELVEASHN